MYLGVITGDIVDSTQILEGGYRDKLLSTMHLAIQEMNGYKLWGKAKIEVFRGDSFQIAVEEPSFITHIAIAFRAKLIANSSTIVRWDARLGLGVGKQEYLSEKISESDGEAFHLSGQAFDSLQKNERLSILTPQTNINEELWVSTSFVDEIISNWTLLQAATFYTYITENLSQKEIAQKEKKSPQSISKIFLAGKFNLIDNYLTRFHQIAGHLK